MTSGDPASEAHTRIRFSKAEDEALSALIERGDASELGSAFGATSREFCRFLVQSGRFEWGDAFDAAMQLDQTNQVSIAATYIAEAIALMNEAPELIVRGDDADLASTVAAQILTLDNLCVLLVDTYIADFVEQWRRSLIVGGHPLPSLFTRLDQFSKAWATRERGALPRKATFVAEPLERGFGLTLGTSLRRVLLSSLPGAAVTAIRIGDVRGEASSLSGAQEKLSDIIRNVKQLAVRYQGEGAKHLQLRAEGPGEVTARQIQTPMDIEVLNPDLVICTLDEGATLNMELTVDTGKGYVPASANRPVDAPIGLIPVDALYSPVRQVAYKVENTRVGQELDYDKLNMTIETDGTVTPEDALMEAARLLQNQLQMIAAIPGSAVKSQWRVGTDQSELLRSAASSLP